MTIETMSISQVRAVFSQLARIKSAHASLTVALAFVASAVSTVLSQDHEEDPSTGSILLFLLFSFLSFFLPFDTLRPRFLAGRFARSLVLPTASTVFAGLTGAAVAAVDNKRYASHTASRNIKYSRAFTTVHGGKERPEGPISSGPPVPAGILRKEDRTRTEE